MAYKIDKNGMLVGDGLPDGVAINMDAYNSEQQKYTSRKSTNLFFDSMREPQVKLADTVSKFKYGTDGKIYAFVPQLERVMTGINPLTRGFNGNSDNQWKDKSSDASTNPLGRFNKDMGLWVEASGIALDEASKSGNTFGEFTFRNEGGAPLAVFGKDKGYMRLAVQNQKAADDLRLGNNSGTTSNVRQNAQRRTLL